MKNIFTFLLLFLIQTIYSQVGVGTTTPKGALDISSTTQGFLMPRVALTATNIAAPVTNPQGGGLEIGTMVFNTATTVTTFGVTPGPYYWDGTKWVSLIHNSFQRRYNQNTNLVVAKHATNYTNIPGLSTLSFTAPYTGTYQFTLTGYLGAITPDGGIFGDNHFGWVEGLFKLTINGTDYLKYQHAESFYNHSTSQQYFELFNEANVIISISLTAGQVCNLNASYRGDNTDGFNNPNAVAHTVGKTGVGALGNECEINVIYLGK